MVCVGLQCSDMTSRGKFWGGSGTPLAPPLDAILDKHIFSSEKAVWVGNSGNKILVTSKNCLSKVCISVILPDYPLLEYDTVVGIWGSHTVCLAAQCFHIGRKASNTGPQSVELNPCISGRD